jgi:ribosomal-protein-alanine N-acetyltransferase
MTSRRVAVFFYGLFMDADLLRAKGLHPERAEWALVEGVALRIGQRAALAPAPGERVHGIVVTLTRLELDRLYSEPSVQMYRPEAVLARLGDESLIPALCYNLPEPPAAAERNPEYAAKLRAVAQKVGLPSEYIASLTPQPTLRTERLLLRPFSLEDATAVQRLAGVREIAATTLNVPHPYLDGVAESWIGTHADAWNRQERVTFAITSAADGLLGAISLHLRPTHRRAELGYWVGQPFWNRGYATEAAGAVIAFGFEALGLNRIHASHFTRNPASARVMLKSGMRFEGILRQHVIKGEHPEDLAEYAILRADPR